ncbi:uncharacterized protein LOC117572730 [Drosophila albomicans]|uniref:Vacuolar ATPase assembly protein VMA22 n=1 Tax=Drosophila albomicans TaxID=7291 RepID=A0A6P8Z4U3_DROAB|nr:uncharacterized protein LOC117572730 [Drosophila albomicans]
MIRDKDQLQTDDSINRNQKNSSMIDESDEENETILEASEPKTTTTIDEETNCLIDVLHLQMLQLMEEHIGQQLTLETHTSRARLILARNRLQQGTSRAAVASQLPAHTPYRALCRVVKEGIATSLKLLRFDVAAAKGFVEPVTHIFGSLVPYSLRLASRKWERCVEHIVECVNVQQELQSVIRSIEQLKWARHRRRIA